MRDIVHCVVVGIQYGCLYGRRMDISSGSAGFYGRCQGGFPSRFRQFLVRQGDRQRKEDFIRKVDYDCAWRV